MKKIGILLPAYNEEKNIKKVINECKRFFPSAFILVVDDGSEDATADIARKLGVVVVSHARNMGKGEALRTGFNYFLKKTDVDVVVVADADGQYPIRYVKRIVEPLLKGNADFVSGYRNWSKVPFRHRLGNFVWRTTFNLLFGTNFRDTNCGLVGFTREALRKVKRTGGGYIIENVLFIEALRNKFRIKQVPVEVKYKNISPVLRGLRVVLGVLFFILKEGIKFRFNLIKH